MQARFQRQLTAAFSTGVFARPARVVVSRAYDKMTHQSISVSLQLWSGARGICPVERCGLSPLFLIKT